MILRWLMRGREAAKRARADADVLIARLGDAAYGEARQRAIGESPGGAGDPHWSRVRREIGRRTGRAHLDTATRYLDP